MELCVITVRISDECPVGYVKPFVTIILTGGSRYCVRLLNSFTDGQRPGGREYIFDYIRFDLHVIGLHIDSLLVEMSSCTPSDVLYWYSYVCVFSTCALCRMVLRCESGGCLVFCDTDLS